MAMVGQATGSAPSARSSSASLVAWPRSRVTAIRRPASGSSAAAMALRLRQQFGAAAGEDGLGQRPAGKFRVLGVGGERFAHDPAVAGADDAGDNEAAGVGFQSEAAILNHGV